MTPITKVGRYRLDGVLGAGSFATVHRAVDDRLEAEVVVKILAENHALNPEIRERFIAEGRSLRRVDNPHVITVHDIGESDRQQPYLVLDYADRGTLADRVEVLRAGGWRAAPADVLAVARPLASALATVHAAGLVHRDLSPRNVLLKSRPEAAPNGERASRVVAPGEALVVADLGMCKDLALNSGLTVAGGTAGFRPPEQEAGPAVIDHRADLWAMSRLLDWLTAGADLPQEFRAALTRSLASDPRNRHRDTREWLADLEAALRGPHGRTELPPQAEPHSGAGSTRRPRPMRAILGAVALAAAFAAGAFGPGWLSSMAAGEPSVTIEGPSTIEVGETATYRAVAPDAESWVWILPNGQYVSDAPHVRLTPRTAGRAEVVIEGRTAAGQRVEVTKVVMVE